MIKDRLSLWALRKLTDLVTFVQLFPVSLVFVMAAVKIPLCPVWREEKFTKRSHSHRILACLLPRSLKYSFFLRFTEGFQALKVRVRYSWALVWIANIWRCKETESPVLHPYYSLQWPQELLPYTSGSGCRWRISVITVQFYLGCAHPQPVFAVA